MCEFITGGGLNAEVLPKSLAKEGALMRDALLRDLIALKEYEVITSHDARLKPAISNSTAIATKDDCWLIWQQLIEKADLVWFVAPESDDILIKLSTICLQYNKPIIGCNNIHTIAIASSKYGTFKALKKANILTIATYTRDDYLTLCEDISTAFIVKPDDGVACEGLAYYEFAAQLHQHLELHKSKLVIQPYQAGIAASICMMCKEGRAWLLSCNTQLIVRENEKLMLKGVIINGMADYWRQFELLAQKIALAMPDLRGFIGVDVIVNNADIFVVEINPRLTTSYVGLSEAMQINPAKLILDCLLEEHIEMPAIAKNRVEILLWTRTLANILLAGT